MPSPLQRGSIVWVRTLDPQGRNEKVRPCVVLTPTADTSLARSNNGFAYADAPGTQVMLAPQALAPAGGGLPHNNMQPYLTLNFCIALQGIFPQRP